jgi:hypothetical protein
MAKSKHHREKRDVKRPPHVPHVPHVSVTIDGRVYHIPVSPPQISVQALIDLAFGLTTNARRRRGAACVDRVGGYGGE